MAREYRLPNGDGWGRKGYKIPCSCTERVKDTFSSLYGEQGFPTGDASAALSLLTEFHDV